MHEGIGFLFFLKNLQEDPEPMLSIIAPHRLRIFQRGGPQGLSHGEISPQSLGIGVRRGMSLVQVMAQSGELRMSLGGLKEHDLD